MVHLDRVSIAATASAAIVGAVAGAVLTEPTAGGDMFGFSVDPPGFPLDSTPTAIAVGGLVALAVVSASRRIRVAIVGMTLGAVILVGAALFDAAAVVGTIGAGSVLGGIVAITRTDPRRSAFTGTVAGFVLGSFVVPALGTIRRREAPTPRRYADYLPSRGSVTVFAGDWVLVVGAALVVIAVVLLAVTLRPRLSESIRRPPARPAAIAAMVLVAGALVFWWFLRWISSSMTSATGLHTFLGGYLLVAVAIVVAVAIPGRRGLVWLAAVAAVASHGADGASASGVVEAAVIAGLIALGATVAILTSGRDDGRRAPAVVCAALIALTILTASQFLDGDTSSMIPAFAGIFLVPVVVGATLVAAVRGDARPHGATVVGALVALPLLTRTTGTSAGWTAYTPLTDAEGFSGFGDLSYAATTTTAIVSAVITTSVCAVCALVLLRRSPTTAG